MHCKADAGQADALFAEEHRCLPLAKLETKWPLGLDLIWTAFKHARAHRILRFFVRVVEDTGRSTFEQNLLGTTGVDTVEPKNIESVLATQFTGDSIPCNEVLVLLLTAYSIRIG